MILETRAVAPFYKNGYVVGCEKTREGVLIDPGDEVEALLEAVGTHKLNIRYILLTHAHLDHITGVKRAKEALGVPVGLHRADNFLYEAVVQQGLAFGFPVEAAAAGRLLLRARRDAEVRRLRRHDPPYAGTLPRRRVPDRRERRSVRAQPVRRRHVVCGIDWPHRSSGRRHRRAAAVDQRGAVRLP